MTAEQHRIWALLVQLHRAAASAADAVESTMTRRVAAIVERATELMLQELQSTPERVTDAALRSLARIMGEALDSGTELMVEAAAAAFDLGTGLAISTVSKFGVVSSQKLTAIANALDETFRPELLSAGRARWYGRLRDEVMQPQSALMNALIEARVRGRSLNEAAAILLENDPDLSSLPSVSRRISVEARARAIVRSESNQILNTAGVLFNEQAGIRRFANMGIGDDRQADTCWVAALAKPMRLNEWATYEDGGLTRPVPWQKRVKERFIPRQFIGPAGRHPNCRCHMVGVFTGFQPSRELMERAGLIPAAA